MDSWRLKLKLWGVRGSIPTPDAQNLGYGGNTSCIEIRLPNDDLVIFDAGSGIRNLGGQLQSAPAQSEKQPLHIFFTHFHWDHIQGVPFFGPLYDPARSITMYSACYSGCLPDALAGQMADPYFPVKFAAAGSKRKFIDLGADPVQIGGLTVQPFELNHPQGASGYRIESNGAVIVYATDREHGHPKLDSVMREFSHDADILIHDAQYTPEEYPRFKGWGHSTWREAVNVAREGNVKQLVLFHHDPSHDDKKLSNIVAETKAEFPNVVGACEGWVATI
jgi:phosphoribosyl 1,2-cyclic phosphodiesterase